jgi:hypothetical protein
MVERIELPKQIGSQPAVHDALHDVRAQAFGPQASAGRVILAADSDTPPVIKIPAGQSGFAEGKKAPWEKYPFSFRYQGEAPPLDETQQPFSWDK